MTNRTYWLKEEAKELISHISQMHGTWSVWASNPVAAAWVRNTFSYYSTILDPASWDSALVFDGEQGELVRMSVPQARTLIRQLVSIVTKQKLAFQCMAESMGSDVVNEVKLGNALLNQIVEEQRLDTQGEYLTEMSCIWGMSFIKACWRTDRGKFHTTSDKGGLLFDGELEISTPSIFDVFFDYTIEKWEDQNWAEVRVIRNKWDLIAQFPQFETEILSLPSFREWRGPHSNTYRTMQDEDMVYVYELYCRPTPALPEGRMLYYSDEKTPYYDGPNTYGEIPVEVMRPEPITGMAFGYPVLSNLLPSQEMLDHSFSAVATNQSALAVQSVAVPRGAGISVQEIGGMNFISYTPQNVPGGGVPTPLQLTQSSPETFKFMGELLSNMQQLSNVSPALRGQPPPGVTSGTAIATITSNALEFISPMSKAYSLCMERILMKALTAYKKFAKIEKVLNIAGKNRQVTQKKFVGKDLDPIKKIKITTVNPALQTIGGRTDIAEKLIQAGFIKDVQQYLSVLEGESPLESLMTPELSENNLIQEENDFLMSGQRPLVLVTDDHPRHIMRHAALLSDPYIRMNNSSVKLILDHMMEHRSIVESMDPSLAAFLAMARTGKTPETPPPQQGPPPQSGPPPGELMAPAGPQTQVAEPANDLLGRS